MSAVILAFNSHIVKSTEQEIKIPVKYPPDKFQGPLIESLNSKGVTMGNAVAGSGKSSTIRLACQLKKDLGLIQVKTSFAHGRAALARYKRLAPIPKSGDWKYANIIKEIIGEKVTKRNDQFKAQKELADIVNFSMCSGIKGNDLDGINNVIDIFGLDCSFDYLPMLVKDVLEEGLKDLNRRGDHGFIDMIYWPVILDLDIEQFDFVLADEAQDFNYLQAEIVRRSMKNSNGLIVGDPHQCQPPDTMIKTKYGEDKRIDNLQVGDKVISFINRDQRFGTGTVKGIAVNSFYGNLINVECSSRSTRCTPNHKFFVRWNPLLYKNHFCVYLMQKGDKFRIGKTRLMLTNKDASFGVSSRMRQEKADKAWIIGVYKTEKEALIEELKYAWSSGIPTVTFEEGIYGKNHRFNINLDQNSLDSFFNHLNDLKEKAEKLLNSLGMFLDLPLCERGSYKKMGLGSFIIYACNIIPEFHCLPSIPMMVVNNNTKSFPRDSCKEFNPIKSVNRIPYAGQVYSLEIDTETYVADGLPTHNSMYGFAGAMPDSFAKIKQSMNATELPLSFCYRCPTSHLELARKIVPHIEDAPNAKRGILEYTDSNSFFSSIDGETKRMILCRYTAPLVSNCIRMIARRIPATVKGADIGKQISKIIDVVEDYGEGKNSIHLFPEVLADYQSEASEKLLKRKNGGASQAEQLDDKCNALLACYNAYKPRDFKDFKSQFEAIFSDRKSNVMFSSIHRSKGLEDDNVAIINEGRCELPTMRNDMEPWEAEQEWNIKYVALTRSKSRLDIIGLEDKSKSNSFAQAVKGYDDDVRKPVEIIHLTEKREDHAVEPTKEIQPVKKKKKKVVVTKKDKWDLDIG